MAAISAATAAATAEVVAVVITAVVIASVAIAVAMMAVPKRWRLPQPKRDDPSSSVGVHPGENYN